MRDHGGDLDRAQATWGDGDWLDLSTGINPVPYPLPALPDRAWGALPTGVEIEALAGAARRAYGAGEAVHCLPLAGAQAAIQLVPRLQMPGQARVVTPTYNEHAAALRAQYWDVAEVPDLDALRGAALGVVVNPNNPDGRGWSPDEILSVASDVGLLIVDESFCDPEPDRSVIPHIGTCNILVLRSFGKFYGLAGLRLGFALGPAELIGPMRALAGPWSVSGPAISVGQAALADARWQEQTRTRLATDARRLDTLAARLGWRLAGGTTLFRTYETGDAVAAQDSLARHHVWSRVFPYAQGWLRLGLPANAEAWQRLTEAMRN